MKTLNIETRLIDVVYGDGKKSVPARAMRGGLAVAPWVRYDGSLSNVFQIIHEESGLKMSAQFNYKIKQAIRIMDWLLEFQDWTGTAIEVVAAFQNGRSRDLFIPLMRLERNGWGQS